MAYIKNKIDWCLKKAQEELKQGKIHRGLVIINPDIEEAKKHINKAKRNLDAIKAFAEIGYSDWSMSAVFYCIYHCFLAIASKFGYESRNQECTIALIRSLKEDNKIRLDEQFIDALETTNEAERHEATIIEKREFYTYGTTTAVQKTELQESIKLCKDCLDQTREIIFSEKK